MIKQPPNMTLAKDSSLAYPGPVPDAIQGSGKIYLITTSLALFLSL
jgi:hypothetical protein